MAIHPRPPKLAGYRSLVLATAEVLCQLDQVLTESVVPSRCHEATAEGLSLEPHSYLEDMIRSCRQQSRTNPRCVLRANLSCPHMAPTGQERSRCNSGKRKPLEASYAIVTGSAVVANDSASAARTVHADSSSQAESCPSVGKPSGPVTDCSQRQHRTISGESNLYIQHRDDGADILSVEHIHNLENACSSVRQICREGIHHGSLGNTRIGNPDRIRLDNFQLDNRRSGSFHSGNHQPSDHTDVRRPARQTERLPFGRLTGLDRR